MADSTELQALSGRLSEAARRLAASDAERAALRLYQGRDRAYELINGLLRSDIDPETLDAEQLEVVEATVTALDALSMR